jgi:hypothetical protein
MIQVDNRDTAESSAELHVIACELEWLPTVEAEIPGAEPRSDAEPDE